VLNRNSVTLLAQGALQGRFVQNKRICRSMPPTEKCLSSAAKNNPAIGGIRSGLSACNLYHNTVKAREYLLSQQFN
jgi:hypothetical protein